MFYVNFSFVDAVKVLTLALVEVLEGEVDGWGVDVVLVILFV